MNSEQALYIRYRVEKAKESLEAAKKIFSISLQGCINRLYYACFYCAIAALLLEGKETRRHATVCRLFRDTFVRTVRFPARLGGFYAQMFDQRMRGDYEDMVVFEESDVEEWIVNTSVFVDTVSTFIDNRLRELEHE
jgi:uncharacterized protein